MELSDRATTLHVASVRAVGTAAEAGNHGLCANVFMHPLQASPCDGLHGRVTSSLAKNWHSGKGFLSLLQQNGHLFPQSIYGLENSKADRKIPWNLDKVVLQYWPTINCSTCLLPSAIFFLDE